MALRVAKSKAPEIGRSQSASPDRFPVWGVATIAATVGAIVLIAPLTASLASSATTLLCLSLLIFGLPHGSLDIAMLRRSATLGARHVALIVTLYLGLAAITYALWVYASVAALASFLLIATVHFAEDWSDDLPPFFAVGAAVALLASPALLHSQAIAEIFVSLTGESSAVTIADLSILIAPVALIATGSAVWLMLREGKTARALETIAVVGGMVLLPPVIGFAIFFCLSHSPKHLSAARRTLRGHDREALMLTCAAMGIAAALCALRPSGGVADTAIFAAFVTLSVLTVPHMIVPHIVKRWRAVVVPQ